MKTALKIAAPLAAMFVAAPMAAQAQNALMADDTSLRAGPGYEYPRVAYVPEDARVYIHGCLRGFNWCDVSWRGDRGWVDASHLTYAWNNRYVVVEEWGPRIGLPVIGFSVQDYWTRYYRDRPWWNQRYTWFERDGRWRDGDRWRDRDRYDRNDNWRERRTDQWREPDGRVDQWRERERRDQWRERQGDRDVRRGDQWRGGERDGLSQREDRLNRQNGEQGGVRVERNRGGDGGPTGRIPGQRQEQRQERGPQQQERTPNPQGHQGNGQQERM